MQHSDEDKTALRSRRENARYGSRAIVAGRPVAVVKSGKKQDFVTAEEFAEALYGKPVERIVFQEPKN